MSIVKTPWSNEETEALRGLVQKYGFYNWERIASAITKRTAEQCRQRWEEFLDPTIAKDEWTPAEELKLVELHAAFPNQWGLIADQVSAQTTGNLCLNFRWCQSR